MKKVNIYTATTFRGVRQQNGVIGYVLEFIAGNGEEVTRSKTAKLLHATPNLAEISVLNDALTRLTMPCELIIYTESGYVKRGMEQWMQGWIQNDWKNAKGEEIANRQEWELLADQLKPHKYSIQTGVFHKYRGWLLTELEVKRRSMET